MDSYPIADWVQALVRENSVAGDTRTCCELIGAWLEAATGPTGAPRVRIAEYEPRKAVLVAETGPTDPESPVVVLTGHLDTVPLGDESEWRHGSLSGDLEDGVIWGRGTVDMKGGCVSCLVAFLHFHRHHATDLPFRLRLVLTTEEEIGMNGAKYLRSVMNCMDKVIAVVVAEPTSLDVGVSEKGLVWMEIHVHGKPAHSAYLEHGLNAIDEAMRVCGVLKALVPNDYDPISGNTTCNVGIVKGGTQYNVVAEDCILGMDFRVSPLTDLDAFERSLYTAIDELQKNDTRGYRYSMKTFSKLEPAVNTDKRFSNSFVTASTQVRSLYSNLSSSADTGTEFGLRFATDAAILCTSHVREGPAKDGTDQPAQEKYTIPFVICGPGPMTMCHVANERVAVSEVHAAADLFIRAIKQYANL